MKKLSILLSVILIAVISINIGCKKDDPTGPTLTVTADPTTAWQNDTVTFTYSVSSNSELQTLAWNSSEFVLVDGTQSDNGEIELSGTNVQSQTLVVVIKGTQTEGTITFTFTATDKDGADYSATKTVDITIDEPAPVETPMNTEITTGVIWNFIGPNQGAWDLVANVGKSSGDAAADKDMVNTTTTTTGWSNEWTNTNNTLFVKANTYDYANATVESATTAYNNGTAVTTVTGPAVDDIYIAKLRGGSTYVVIKVTAVTVTTSDNLDKIEFKYKKQ